MRRILLFAFCLIGICGGLSAHDLYLRPANYRLDAPGSVALAQRLAEAFPGEEVEWRGAKTVDFRLSGPQGVTHPAGAGKQNPVLRLEANGTYVVGWSATASFIEIPPAEFLAYVKSEGYKEVQRSLESDKIPKPGREKYVRFLKAYLQVGSEEARNFAEPFGYKIEFIPLSNPCSVKVGETLSVKLLFDGKPLSGAAVKATFDTYSTEHEVYAVETQTGGDGIARIPIAKSGVWMVRANHMLPETEDPKADWQSFWANISFEVR